MRKLSIALIGLLGTTTLVGCSSVSDFACEAAVSGDQVQRIEVSTDLSSAPKLTFPSPLSAETTQREIVVSGDGEVFTGRNLMEFEFAGYNGGSGQLVQQTSFNGSDIGQAVLGPDATPSFCPSLVGAREGSRIVTIIPPDLAHGGEGIPGLGFGPTDSFIFVFDLKKVYLDRATGREVAAESGMPAVVRSPLGIPGVSIPKAAPPRELRVATLIQGQGSEVKDGNEVVLHYSGFVWDTGSKFQASWDNEQPAIFTLERGGLIDGFYEALLGKNIGSQILAVIPPELGYGQTGSASIPPNATLIFVIDILGVRD